MTRKDEIEGLLRTGRRLTVGSRVLDVRWLENTIGYARLAIVVPRYSFTAVRRNKVKRRLRELARVHLLPAACSCDVLIRARRDAFAVSFDRLRADVSDIVAALPSGSRAAGSP